MGGRDEGGFRRVSSSAAAGVSCVFCSLVLRLLFSLTPLIWLKAMLLRKYEGANQV